MSDEKHTQSQTLKGEDTRQIVRELAEKIGLSVQDNESTADILGRLDQMQLPRAVLDDFDRMLAKLKEIDESMAK